MPLRRGPARLRPGDGLAPLGCAAAPARAAGPRRAGPSSPACCPSCSSRRRTPRSPCRSRPTSTACGCSTPWPTPCSPRPPPGVLVLDDLQHVDRETCRLVHYLDAPRADRPAAHRRDGAPRGDRPRPSRPGAAGGAARARPVHRDRAGPPRPGRDRPAGARARWRAARRANASTPRRRATRCSWSRPCGCGPGAPVSRRVQTVLEARLAQLSGPARALAEVAATIGREFRVDVLAAAAGEADDVLLDGLDELWRRRILREQDAQTYRFSHDKLREVAALGVSPPRRRLLHLRIAPALEHAHAADPGPVSAQIARHYAEGGSAGHAVTWYRRAAEAAQELHASRRRRRPPRTGGAPGPHAAAVAESRRRRAGAAERGPRPARVDHRLRRPRHRGAPAGGARG